MNKREFPKSGRIQLAWAMVPLTKKASTNIIRKISGQSSDYVAKCTKDMRCLKDTKSVENNHGGRHSPVYERIELAGKVCNTCPAVAGCIIRDLANSEDNWKFVPLGLHSGQYYF